MTLTREQNRLLADWHTCDRCEAATYNPEDDYGEFICDDCLSNLAEVAYERYCADFHDGGSTAPWPDVERMRQEAARKLK